MKHKKILACFLTFSFLLTGCSTKDQSQSLSMTGTYFDTVVKIEVWGADSKIMDGCKDICEKYEQLLSPTIDSSEISQINQAQGASVSVSKETADLIELGKYYGDLSGGKFDITIASASDLWNFHDNADHSIPDAGQLAEAVTHINYKNIEVNGTTVTMSDPYAKIDLGGIAKGYIADQVKNYLVEEGIEHAYINLGGNILTLGGKTDGSNFRIGIQKPFSDDGTAIASVEVSDETVVSSGVYERYFYVGDNFYHHILNPKTGYPYDNNLLGVTIICPKSVDGDGLSTTCFALGLEDGMKLIESLDDTEAIFITDDYELHTTSGIGSNIPFHEM